MFAHFCHKMVLIWSASCDIGLRSNYPINDYPALVEVMSWCHQATRHYLTPWSQVTHIYVSKLTTIGSDNGLSPGRHKAIIWTSAGILLFGPLGTNFSEILIEIHIFLFRKMHLKMSSGKWQPFCLSLNVLSQLWLRSASSYVVIGPQSLTLSFLQFSKYPVSDTSSLVKQVLYQLNILTTDRQYIFTHSTKQDLIHHQVHRSLVKNGG